VATRISWRGENIPLGARIILICDAYNAMTGWQPYAEPMSAEDAIDELRQGAGTQFDPTLTEMFIERVSPTVAG